MKPGEVKRRVLALLHSYHDAGRGALSPTALALILNCHRRATIAACGSLWMEGLAVKTNDGYLLAIQYPDMPAIAPRRGNLVADVGMAVAA